MFYPCTTKSIRSGIKTIAVVNFVWTLGLIVLELFLAARYGLRGVETLDPEFAENLDSNTTTITMDINNNSSIITTSILSKKILSFTINTIALSMIWIISWLVDMAFSILLFSAASYKSIKQSLVWFYFRCAVLVIRVICLVFYIIAGLPIFPTKIPVILLFVFRVYSLWVVNSFVNELRAEASALEASKNNPTVVVTTPQDSKQKDGNNENGIENVSFSKE